MSADKNGTYPELVMDVGTSAPRPVTAATSSLGQAVESALREVLAWRPRTSDPQGFVAALNQAFTMSEVEGHTEWSWAPRSYAIQADMGAVTGAQASIYARARAALDQSIPLLEGLYPLRPDADEQEIESSRAVVRSTLTELVSELGMVGGPRVPRVKALFRTLLGDVEDSERKSVGAGGLLRVMRKRFGLKRDRVNTIDEEQNLTNYLILREHVIALYRSWQSQSTYFDRQGNEVFLGTQLVLLSRALAVVAESVQQAYFVMDSVFLSEAERQTIQLTFESGSLTIAELLGWVERFATEEGPRVIREAGKDGVIALCPIVDELGELVKEMRNLSAGGNERNANSKPSIPLAFQHKRVTATLDELAMHLENLKTLFEQLNPHDKASMASKLAATARALASADSGPAPSDGGVAV